MLPLHHIYNSILVCILRIREFSLAIFIIYIRVSVSHVLMFPGPSRYLHRVQMSRVAESRKDTATRLYGGLRLYPPRNQVGGGKAAMIMYRSRAGYDGTKRKKKKGEGFGEWRAETVGVGRKAFAQLHSIRY